MRPILTPTFIIAFVIFSFICINITKSHTSEYAVESCTEDNFYCVNIEKERITSRFSVDLTLNNATNLTLTYDGKEIKCSLEAGRIIFDDVCSKEYLSKLVKTNNVKLSVPEFGIKSASLRPVLGFGLRGLLLRISILWEKALFWLIAEISALIASIISLFK